MKVKFNVLLCGSAAIVLSACESSGGGTETPANAFAFSDVNVGTANFDILSNAAAAAPTTLANDLPSGSATYDGLMTVTIADNIVDGVLGTVRLAVEFDSNSLSGSAGSFRNFSDEATGGSLTISGGTISTVGVADGIAQVNGTINFEAGPMTINETYTHSFGGVNGEYNFGAALDGTAQPSSGLPVDIISSWTVERQ